MTEVKIIKTEDGSHSLYVPSLSEHYHSIHGAIQESNHVFIESGLNYSAVKYETIDILEIGMGTGLNVFLTYMENCKLKKIISYHALEPNVLSENIISQLNYVEIIGKNSDIFQRIHNSDWNKIIDFGNRFSFKKYHNSIQNVSLINKYNLIYFDAFAPDKQPELWTLEIFKKIFNYMKSNSILVTYCAKGTVKKILKEAGFVIESLKGPPGKREMTRAIKAD